MTEYIYEFDIASIILTSMLILIAYTHRSYPVKSFKIYKVLLWLNLVSSCADLVSAFSLSNIVGLPIWLNYIINIVYLLSHNLIAIFFLMYLLVIIRGNYGKIGEKIIWISTIALDVFLIAFSPLTHWVFYFENGLYMHGFGMIPLYIFAGIVMAYALILFIVNNKILSRFQLLTDIVFLGLMIISVIVQYFFPHILIESFVISVCLLMTNISLDNPSIYLYKNTSCYNNNAFYETVNSKNRAKSQVHLVAFSFNEQVILRKKFSDETRQHIINKTIEKGQKLFGQKNFYIISGDTFVVDINDQPYGKAIGIIENETKYNFLINGESIKLTPHYCVVGTSDLTYSVGELTETIEIMLGQVYKKTGERVICDTSKVLEGYRREVQIVHLLRNAIANDGFDIYYQPIYDNNKKTYVSAEALIRLKSKELGFVGPDEFIPIAEENGLIIEIGEVVLQKVCRFWRNNNFKKYGIKWLDVNLSPVQLLEKYDVEIIEETCKRYGVLPENLNFEITETAGKTQEEMRIISDQVKDLVDKGFYFSLDDYGSGFSTATYFAEMPFKIIKVDKNILWKAMTEESFKIVLQNTLEMCKKIGRVSLVEGVENQEMVDMLNEIGCDYFQGYLFAKPLTETDFLNLIKEEYNKNKNSKT